jgi:E3 ubiquitin-protein ligase HECTD2
MSTNNLNNSSNRTPQGMHGGNCPCCGLRLEYPPDVSAFRCTICNSVTDLNPIPIIVEDGYIFSSSSALSQQFFNESDAGRCESSFDMISMQKEFTLLFEKDISDVDLVLNKIQAMITRPGRLLQSSVDIRFLFIILEFLDNYKLPNPLIFELRYRVFGFISNLNNNLHSVGIQKANDQGSRSMDLREFICNRVFYSCGSNQYHFDSRSSFKPRQLF